MFPWECRAQTSVGSAPAEGGMSSAGRGGTAVCGASVGSAAVLWDLLLLLQTGIGAGNTDNFIYLLLTR